jgi:hypothetical protein
LKSSIEMTIRWVSLMGAIGAAQHCLVLREETCDMRDRGRMRVSCVCLDLLSKIRAKR